MGLWGSMESRQGYISNIHLKQKVLHTPQRIFSHANQKGDVIWEIILWDQVEIAELEDVLTLSYLTCIFIDGQNSEEKLRRFFLCHTEYLS